MNTPESLREFTQELIRRGLPAEYSRRAAEELADHYGDLVEECLAGGMSESTAHASADERLGNTKSLVKKTVRAYQQRHWCGRWRVTTFLLGPVPLLIVVWNATLYSLAAVGRVLGATGFDMPDSSHDLSTFGLVILYAVAGWFLLVVPAVLVLALSRLAIRSGVGRGWFVASAVLLAISAGFVRAGFHPTPETVEHPFMVSIPLLMPFQSLREIVAWYVGSPQQIVQSVLPVLVAAILLWRNTAQRHRLPLAV